MMPVQSSANSKHPRLFRTLINKTKLAGPWMIVQQTSSINNVYISTYEYKMGILHLYVIFWRVLCRYVGGYGGMLMEDWRFQSVGGWGNLSHYAAPAHYTPVHHSHSSISSWLDTVILQDNKYPYKSNEH